MSDFGDYIRQRREELRETDRGYSVRQVAARVEVEPSYLSKIERGEQPPP
jgi:HTH-type transcriptional regulator, competence development regulator